MWNDFPGELCQSLASSHGSIEVAQLLECVSFFTKKVPYNGWTPPKYDERHTFKDSGILENSKQDK
jgi:hypothetical protein